MTNYEDQGRISVGAFIEGKRTGQLRESVQYTPNLPGSMAEAVKKGMVNQGTRKSEQAASMSTVAIISQNFVPPPPRVGTSHNYRVHSD